MGKIIKKNLIIIILAILFADMAIGYFLIKSRAFSHLAIWNIIESSKKEDFYWQPENAPGYFYFEPPSGKISVFRDEFFPLVKNQDGEFKIALKVARYVTDICSDNYQPVRALKWDSPEGMLAQVREGASANCFHRAILLSSYLSSLGIKSRLWTLENDNFNAVSHSVNEVYIPGLKKWVFMDVMFGFYVVEKGIPLSFLEFRERLLQRNVEKISFQNIRNENNTLKETPFFYSRLVKTVFLRSSNDFVNKYNARIRYGAFSVFAKPLDKLPNNTRIGLSYLLGRKEFFIHYVDKYSQSLRVMVSAAKFLFYFFIFSWLGIGVLLLNLSKKDIRQR